MRPFVCLKVWTLRVNLIAAIRITSVYLPDVSSQITTNTTTISTTNTTGQRIYSTSIHHHRYPTCRHGVRLQRRSRNKWALGQMQTQWRSRRWIWGYRRSTDPSMTHSVWVFGFNGSRWWFKGHTFREWQCWRCGWIVERCWCRCCCCSLGTCYWILEEILQSSDKFELFDVNWANGGCGEWWTGWGIWWA